MNITAAWQKDTSERVELFRAWYARRNERPLLGFFLGSDFPIHRYPTARTLPEGRPLRPDDFDVDGYVRDSLALFEAHEACGGDFIWAATAFWGIPWLEAMVGCPIYADHASGSIYSEPPSDFGGSDSLPCFDPDGDWARLMDRFFRALANNAPPGMPLATTRMRGVSDLLSALYGREEFVIAMFERPEEVRETAERLADFWLDCARFQLARIPPFHGGIGSFYYSVWAPDGTVWHQEDAAALLNPELYKEFIAPCDRRIAGTLHGCIMHLHSSGYVPLDPILEMSFRAVELHRDTGGEDVRALRPLHQRILARKPLLVWGKMGSDELDGLLRGLPAAGLAVQLVVGSPEEARAAWAFAFGRTGG